jgi:two-component system, OmpR family, phosphate regulon sensor histidine kinase PhoR
VRANFSWQYRLALVVLLLATLLWVELRGAGASRLAFIWLTGMLIVLALSVIVAFAASQTVNARIRRLEKFSQRVASGDFRALETEKYNDELAMLARAMNETAARLAQTIRSLKEEHGRTAAILRSMAEGVAVVGADERVVFSNAAFAQIIGWSVNDRSTEPGESPDLPSQGRMLLVELVRQSELLALVKQTLSEGHQVESEVTVGTLRPRTFAVTAAPVRAREVGPGARDDEEAPPGEAIGAVLVLHDISELRRLERVRRDFVANVSHEFKTPLTAIRGFAETLLAGALEDADHRRRFVEIIQEHAERLTRLTDDLLKLSKIEAGQMELDLRPQNATELVELCVNTARFGAERKQHSIEVDCPEDLPAVSADAGRFRDVLQNLLDNAVQYTPRGGHIRVSAAAQNGEVIFTVADDGIGIPEAEQERIFERFYRVDVGRSREVGGTGLGLSIARHITEAHGGRIWVESTVGQGSRFHVAVPVSGPRKQ